MPKATTSKRHLWLQSRSPHSASILAHQNRFLLNENLQAIKVHCADLKGMGGCVVVGLELVGILRDRMQRKCVGSS